MVDNVLALAGNNPYRIRLVSADSGEHLRDLPLPYTNFGPSLVRFSPDGRMLAVAFTWADEWTLIYDTATWEVKYQLGRNVSGGLRFSNDSSRIYEGTVDGLTVTDAATGHTELVMAGMYYEDIATNRDDSRFLVTKAPLWNSGDPPLLIEFDATTNEIIRSTPIDNSADTVYYSLQEDLIILAYGSLVRVFSAEDHSYLYSLPDYTTFGAAFGVRLTADPSIILYGAGPPSSPVMMFNLYSQDVIPLEDVAWPWGEQDIVVDIPSNTMWVRTAFLRVLAYSLEGWEFNLIHAFYFSDFNQDAGFAVRPPPPPPEPPFWTNRVYSREV